MFSYTCRDMFIHMLQIMHSITEAYRPSHNIFSPFSVYVHHFKHRNKKL